MYDSVKMSLAYSCHQPNKVSQQLLLHSYGLKYYSTGARKHIKGAFYWSILYPGALELTETMLRLVVVVLAITTATFVSGWKQPARLKSVSGNLNYVWAVRWNDGIIMCQRPCTGWKHIPGKLLQVDVDHDEVIGVSEIGAIFARPVDGSGYWKLIPE